MNNSFLDNNRVPENMTIKDLENFIYTKVYAPIYSQILSFDNKKISNEETQLRNINFEMNFNNIPHENDFIDIEVEDYIFYNNLNKKGNFILRINLFNDIMNQICKFKKLSSSNLYLIYNNNFSNYEYQIIADHHFGKKIIVE